MPKYFNIILVTSYWMHVIFLTLIICHILVTWLKIRSIFNPLIRNWPHYFVTKAPFSYDERRWFANRRRRPRGPKQQRPGGPRCRFVNWRCCCNRNPLKSKLPGEEIYQTIHSPLLSSWLHTFIWTLWCSKLYDKREYRFSWTFHHFWRVMPLTWRRTIQLCLLSCIDGRQPKD